MELWKKLLIHENSTIINALRIINEGSVQIALVVNEDLRLLGTITDGDIRNAILHGYGLEDSANRIMNPNPIKCIKKGDNQQDLIKIMLKHRIHQLPLVDTFGRIVGLETIDELLMPKGRNNLIVVMAGGMGNRLKPLTNNSPKPMLQIGGKPLLEVIIEKLKSQGFHRFCFTVGYKAEIIKDYFCDGSLWDVHIEYIQENKPLGTAGSLSYLKDKEKDPVIVMNGDLLTNANLNYFLNFHQESKADCSISIRDYNYQLPYGVIELNGQEIVSIQEKPTYNFFVNAGLYILNSYLLDLIPENTFYPMTVFIQNILDKNYQIKGFPLLEQWSDIGCLNEYEKAKKLVETNDLS